MFCPVLKLSSKLITILVDYFAATVEHTILELSAIDVTIYEIHDSTLHSTFLKKSCKLVAIDKFYASTFSYSCFSKDSCKYVSIFVSKSAFSTFALYKITDVVRGDRMLSSRFLILLTVTNDNVTLFADGWSAWPLPWIQPHIW